MKSVPALRAGHRIEKKVRTGRFKKSQHGSYFTHLGILEDTVLRLKQYLHGVISPTCAKFQNEIFTSYNSGGLNFLFSY